MTTIHELRQAITKTVENAEALTAMLDELAVLRAKERLRADALPAAATDDLPPDAPTGLFLDRAFSAEDFVWIKMAFDKLLQSGVQGQGRPGQIMLVFQSIRRDERATAEFFRVMNTIMLPLLRRIRLKEQLDLVRLGAASE
jgi:hypothetical protein